MDKERKELDSEAWVLQVRSRSLVMMRGSRVMLKGRMRS